MPDTNSEGKLSSRATTLEGVREAVGAARRHTDFVPQAAIILGTGLGGLAGEIERVAEIPYGDIPGFVKSTVETHSGKLVFGSLEGVRIVAMQGRFHRYEGYSMQEITFPVRVLRALGAGTLLVSNAAGGINRRYYPGDLMAIEDHINLMGDNPLIGPNDERLGPRYPDLYDCYDAKLRDLCRNIAREEKVVCHTGVYAAMTGPSLETAAEYRMLDRLGADAIGMSTVPEVLVAVHSGMRVLGISVITDRCVADALKPADVAEIIRTAQEAEPRLTLLMKRVIGALPL